MNYILVIVFTKTPRLLVLVIPNSLFLPLGEPDSRLSKLFSILLHSTRPHPTTISLDLTAMFSGERSGSLLTLELKRFQKPFHPIVVPSKVGICRVRVEVLETVVVAVVVVALAVVTFFDQGLHNYGRGYDRHFPIKLYSFKGRTKIEGILQCSHLLSRCGEAALAGCTEVECTVTSTFERECQDQVLLGC